MWLFVKEKGVRIEIFIGREVIERLKYQQQKDH